jgi:hypothetical protein
VTSKTMRRVRIGIGTSPSRRALPSRPRILAD